MKELLSSREAAELFGVHLGTIHRWAAKGKLRPISKVGQYKFTRDEIQRLMVERQKQTRDAADWKRSRIDWQ